MNGGVVTAQPADRSAVYLSVFANGQYQLQKIGGPAGVVFPSGGPIYAAEPSMTGIWKYSGTPMKWDKVGGAASMWVLGWAGLFGLTPAKDAVYQYNNGNWKQIGGAAGAIFAGATAGQGDTAVDFETAPSSLFALFATNPTNNDLWGYRTII